LAIITGWAGLGSEARGQLPNVGFWPTNYTVSENCGFVQIPVLSSSAALRNWPTVDYETVDGTAVGGLNFVPTRGTICFTNGQSKATIRIPFLRDGLTSVNRSFALHLLNPRGGLELAWATATITLTDADGQVPGWIEPVSVVDTNVLPADGTANWSDSPVVTSDGRFVFFTSGGAGLVPGSTNLNAENVYRRDLWSNSTELVTCAADGVSPSRWGCYAPCISPDGSWVAFAIFSPVSATNGILVTYLRDIKNHVTSAVSLNTNNMPCEGWPYTVSDDGRYVIFESSAPDITSNKFNSAEDLFVRDLWNGVTTLVTADANGKSPSTRSNIYASAFGLVANRYIFFNSTHPDLVPGDWNSTYDAFRYDLDTREITLISVNEAGTGAGNGDSRGVAVSADGRYVLLSSTADDLVDFDFNGHYDVFLRDLWSNTTTLVSTNLYGLPGNGDSACPTMTRDARYVAFQSLANDLVPEGRTFYPTDVFIWDLTTGETRLAIPGGAYPSISPGGHFLVAQSEAPLTAAGESRYLPTAQYVLDLTTGAFDMLTRAWVGDNRATIFLPPCFDEADSMVVYLTDGDLVPGDLVSPLDYQVDASDVYVWRPGPAPNEVDLALTAGPATTVLTQQTNITWSVAVTNGGAREATGVHITSSSKFIAASSSTGSQGGSNPANPADFTLGSLAPGATASVSFTGSTVYWPKSRDEVPVIRVYSAQPDATPYNNQCTINLIVSPPDADADGDGMPNAWESANGLDPASGVDALLDSDEDGAPNLLEFLSGTDPRSPESCFRITSVRVTSTNVVFRFPSAADRYYGLERKTDLLSGNWQTVTNDVPGTGAEMDLVDSAPLGTNSTRVYRATVSP